MIDKIETVNQSHDFHTQQRRSYRETNSYVPTARSYRNTSTHTSNGYNQRATPADVYESMPAGSGQQFTGPFVTKGNAQGREVVAWTKMYDNVKKFVASIAISTDHNTDGQSYGTSPAGVKITFTDQAAAKAFNEAQGAYDQAVKDIRSANQIEPYPANGTPQEKAEWMEKARQSEFKSNLQILMLGPSPTQQAVNDAEKNKSQYDVEKSVELLPEIRPKR